MDDYVSESDSDYTSYWRDWVRPDFPCPLVGFSTVCPLALPSPRGPIRGRVEKWKTAAIEATEADACGGRLVHILER